jgi:uncharacterized protein YdgA (DUF945 family)
VFGIRSLNIFKLGSITSEGKIDKIPDMPKFLEKEVKFVSSIGFSGIDTNFFAKENSLSLEDDETWRDKEPVLISWKDINLNIYVSFDRDVLNFDADIPYFAVSSNKTYEKFSIVIEDQKYSSRSSDKKVGFWLGDSSAEIGKIKIISKSSIDDNYYRFGDDEDDDESYDDDDSTVEDVESVVTLSGLGIYSDIKDEANSTLAVNTKITLGTLGVESNSADEKNKTIENIVLDLSLQNLDLESMKKIYESMSDLNPTDEKAMIFVLLAWAGYVPDILSKKPKIVLEELSAKYEGQTNKIKGFIQYIGKGDIKTLYNTWQKDLAAKLDFDISEKIGKEIIKDKLPSWEYDTDEELQEAVEEKLKSLEKSYNIKIQNGAMKGSFEYKDGKQTLNGKEMDVLEDNPFAIEY